MYSKANIHISPAFANVLHVGYNEYSLIRLPTHKVNRRVTSTDAQTELRVGID
jgi:hypothetical protein